MTAEIGDWLIVAFTFVVAGSTVAYVILTWRLVTETRRMRKAQTEPQVSVRVELAETVGHGAMELVVRNEGQGPAQNIRFGFEGDPTYFVDNGIGVPIDQVPVIKNGLPHLGPGQQFRFLLGWLFGDAFDHATREPWTFQVVYAGLSGKSKSDTFTLDFSQFSGLMVGGGPPLVKIEKHLKKLQKDVGHLSTGFRKLYVLTETKEDFDQRREEAWQAYKDQFAGTNDVSVVNDDQEVSR